METIVNIIITILLFILSLSLTKITSRKNTIQLRKYTKGTKKIALQNKIIKNNKPTTLSYNTFINSERKKEMRKKSNIFSFLHNREVDCDLDERIFGPKNQHKDLF